MYERILDNAIVALGRTTGINARVHPATVGQHRETDAMIKVETDRYKEIFQFHKAISGWRAVGSVHYYAAPFRLPYLGPASSLARAEDRPAAPGGGVT